jgi:hypothetical protein
MTENSWVLKGVEPAARQRAVEEAERRGVSLADYLTDIVLQNALAEQVREQGAALLGETEDAASPVVEGRSEFAVRQRLKALERRLSTSIASLDSALHALDGSAVDLTARLGDVEGLAGDTAHALGLQVHELNGGLAILREGLTAFEETAAAQAQGNQGAHLELAAACGELDERIDGVEAIARGADRAAATLFDAQQAFRLSVAEDLETLSRETSLRVGAGLDEVRAAAESAAEQADAAAAHLIAELRGLRESIDDRLAQNAADARNRMHAAFAEAGDRLAALSDRITDSERHHTLTVEQTRREISNIEDGAQTALEETANALRHADASLAADITRVDETARIATDLVRAELADESAEARERHLGLSARLAHVEVAAAGANDNLAALRAEFERRIAAATTHAEVTQASLASTLSERLDSVTQKTVDLEQDAAHTRRMLGAEIGRVEACTLAALEKQAADRTAGEAALQQRIEDAAVTALESQAVGRVATEAALTRRIDDTARSIESALEHLRQHVEVDGAAARGQQASALVRLDCIEAALGADGQVAAAVTDVSDLRRDLARINDHLADRPVDRDVAARLATLEQAEGDMDVALDLLRRRVETIAERAPAAPQEDLAVRAAVEDLRARLAAFEANGADTTDRVHGIARTLGRVSAQNADASAQADDRLHKVEIALADLRLNQLAAPEPQIDAEVIAAIELRIAGFEHRQAEALDTLVGDISHFIEDNGRRLGALESYGAEFGKPFAGIEQRLAELEHRDIAADFANLRLRIEDRILSVEQRSVRALEQVSETVALLEKRLIEAAEDTPTARSA